MQMGKTAMSPAQIAEVLVSELRKGTFYIKGWDDGQPVEMLHTMLQLRTDDIIQARAPLSHLLRNSLGKEGRDKINNARKQGLARLSKL